MYHTSTRAISRACWLVTRPLGLAFKRPLSETEVDPIRESARINCCSSPRQKKPPGMDVLSALGVGCNVAQSCSEQ